MRRSLIYLCVLLAVGVSACSYSKQRWKELKKQAERRIDDAKSPEEKCAKREGTLFNGQCYTPAEHEPEFTQEECRLRAGLYLDDQCLFPPGKGIVVEREAPEEEAAGKSAE